MTPAAPARSPSLRDRNKVRLRRRIVEAAAGLVATRGLDDVTADHIAAAAEVGRATFFRYFGSKEEAVITGFYEQRLTALVEALGEAPRELGPMDAVLWTFRELGKRQQPNLKLVRLHARMVTTSPLLRARAMEFHARYAQAIADAVAGRFRKRHADDMRPQLLAVAVLAVVQACIEHWAASKDVANPSALVLDGLERLQSGFAERVP
jgi:AcrR family transcriptional regulator